MNKVISQLAPPQGGCGMRGLASGIQSQWPQLSEIETAKMEAAKEHQWIKCQLLDKAYVCRGYAEIVCLAPDQAIEATGLLDLFDDAFSDYKLAAEKHSNTSTA